MPSVIYHSAIRDLFTGAIDADTDSFRAMLIDASYTPDKDAHARRDDVEGAEVAGAGYAAGGAAAALSVAIDGANDRIEITLGAVSWPSSSITARGLVYYWSRGGAASADELVAFIDRQRAAHPELRPT